MSGPSSSAAPRSLSTGRSLLLRYLRFYLVWAARLLLPFLYALSLIKPVIIPSTSTSSSTSLSSPSILPSHITPLLIITHSRHHYLSKTLASILAHHPGDSSWPLVISKDQQDGPHPQVDAVIASFRTRAAARHVPVLEWDHAFSYDDTTSTNAEPSFVDEQSYRRISRHYGWALRRLFAGGTAGGLGGIPMQVVILEDDMDIAPDFFGYFNALRPMLHADASLLCVSAWNDNGVASLSQNLSQLHRTDFFPGLGWMLTRSLWRELVSSWPPIFWDDWLRRPEQTRGRQCIRPEVSRVANFGELGVSKAFHYTTHVSRVVRATTAVDFYTMDLQYLKEDEYYRMFFERFSKATRLRFSNYLTSRPQHGDVIAFYPEEHLEAIGKRTGIMIDHRNGVRRTSYHGVIVIPWNGHWAFIVKRGWQPPEGYTLGVRDCC